MTRNNLRLAALFFGPTVLGAAAVKGFGWLLLLAGISMLACLLMHNFGQLADAFWHLPGPYRWAMGHAFWARKPRARTVEFIGRAPEPYVWWARRNAIRREMGG